MITTLYQIIKIGEDNSFYSDILDTFYTHLAELGLQKECVIEIDENNFATEYRANLIKTNPVENTAQ